MAGGEAKEFRTSVPKKPSTGKSENAGLRTGSTISGENEPSTLWIDLVEGASVALRKDVPANLNVPEDAHFQWVFFGNLIKNKHHIARQ